MKTLQDVRHILKTISRDVEVLPAVGGAAEDLERPDLEEQEDQAFNQEERVFEIWERDVADPGHPYRPTPPLSRVTHHRYRYFLDGSLRSYLLGNVLEHERESPVYFAQVGAGVVRREDNGSVRREVLQINNVLLVGCSQLSDEVCKRLKALAAQQGIALLDLTKDDEVNRGLTDVDLRHKAAGKVRYAMHLLETGLLQQVKPHLAEDRWLILDGSLLFPPTLDELVEGGQITQVIGVAKSFRKDILFILGRGPRARRYSIYRLLAGLRPAHRTLAFGAREGKVVFWYVRLRESTSLDHPLMGVVKVELANPSREPVPSAPLDELSGALVAERQVTPHGLDRRWHVHLYPIFLAERRVRESLLPREAVQQYLRWR